MQGALLPKALPPTCRPFQGEAMASHIFGFTIVDIMDRIFAPKVVDCGRLFVHDDTSLTGEIFRPPTPDAIMPTTTHPSITPLPYAVELFAYILLHYTVQLIELVVVVHAIYLRLPFCKDRLSSFEAVGSDSGATILVSKGC